MNEYKGDGGKNGMEGRVERKTRYWILRNERAGGCYMTGFFFLFFGICDHRLGACVGVRFDRAGSIEVGR